MENDKETLTKKILNGWKNLISGSSQPQKKPFPENRFFSAEQLSFLSKQKNTTLLEKWAVEIGRETAEKSSAKAKFSPVQWSDGLFGSWVDGNPYFVDDRKQADYLKMLRDNGYDLRPEHEKFIMRQEKNSLLGKTLADKDSYYIIEDSDISKKSETKFILHSFRKEDMEDATIPFDLDMFHDEMRKGSMNFITDEERLDFVEKLTQWNDAKNLFKETMQAINQSNVHPNGGVFTAELSFGHSNSSLGNYELSSWKSDNGHTIDVTVKLEGSKKATQVMVSEENAYKYRDLVKVVSNMLTMEQTNLRQEQIQHEEDKISSQTPLMREEQEKKVQLTNNPKGRPIQGLELYDKQDLKDLVADYFKETFEDVENAPSIKEIEVYGSRARGTAKKDSDLDVVIEYEGDRKEDSVFNALHETLFEIEGIKVDINPINRSQSKSLGDFMQDSRKYDQEILAKSKDKPRFSIKEDSISENLDREYMEAIESGDMKKAQQMVNAAAASKGYASTSNYQGTSAFNGAAPWGNGYFNSPEERKKAWESDPEHLEYEGDQTLADYIENGVDSNNLDYVALDQRFYRSTNEERKEAILNVRQTIQSKGDTITMYRSVPSSVKEDSFRNGDWVTPSKQYAIDNAAVHGWGNDYRIIEQEVPTNEVWWDGNDIAEWGYGREEDYVNDKDFGYKNTANNKKLLDAVTYDDNGKAIPLSKRFNENIKDIRYQDVSEEKALTMEEVELRETLVDKLRSSGISVVTDTNVGQHVLDRARFFCTEKGEAYGFTVDGKIYIDPKIATAETPIHEYTHLWATALQKGNPKEWANIVGLMKDTSVWNEVKESYQDLKTDDEIADEVLATYSGRRGSEKLRQMAAEVKNGDYSAAKKASVSRAIFQVQEALNKFWKEVSSFLGIHYNSAEEVADRVMKDMLNEVNPIKKLQSFTEARNKEYMEAVKDGNLDKAYAMVVEQADIMLASNPMPEVTDAYEIRKTAPPKNTVKVYKVFTLDKDGDPTALFVSGKDKLPQGVWLNAQDTWHFTAENGKQYVPSTKNPASQGGKTGASIKIPSDEVRQELIKRGYLPEESKAKAITVLAYRPGWHAADLPYFPQGGKQDTESNYGNVHRYNQVVFECDLAADIDYTPLARNQTKAFNSKGKLNVRDADLQWMPKEGFYQYTTNQFLSQEDKGHWYIGGSIRINRALTQEECDKILADNGKAAQEWEQGILDLQKLNYTSSVSHVKPILSPVAYYENGDIVPLSERFRLFKEEFKPNLDNIKFSYADQTETEEIARKNQLVIIQSPEPMDFKLAPNIEGRWHNKEMQEPDMYSRYGEILADYLKGQGETEIPWNTAREVIDVRGNKFEDINSYMMDLTYYNFNKFPIYMLEQEIKSQGYSIATRARPIPILRSGKVVEVYNVGDILNKENQPLSSTHEVHTRYESWKRLNEARTNSMDVFPTENHEEFKDLSHERFKEVKDYRKELASALVNESRGKLPDTPSAASKESFIRVLSTAMLGKKYGFREVSSVNNPMRLAARLERDPKFVKSILMESAKTSCKVGTFIEETVRSWGEDKKLDLRSLNSVDMDEDGNGIVDNQEDLAPETLNESTGIGKDETKNQVHRLKLK